MPESVKEVLRIRRLQTPLQQQQVRMYGVTETQMEEAVKSSLSRIHASPAMMVMSLLSDAQELIEHGDKEDARQTINRAKWVLHTHIMKEIV